MNGTIIDIIVLLAVAGFAILGTVRGLVRELIGTAGVLLAVVFNDRWGDLWSPDAASTFGLDPATAQFSTYAAIFILVVLLVNYLAPSLILRHTRIENNRSSRGLGFVLGLFNGSVIAAYLLDYMHRFLYNSDPASPVLQAATGKFMRDWASWSILVLVGGLLLATFISLFTRSARTLTGPDVPAVYPPRQQPNGSRNLPPATAAQPLPMPSFPQSQPGASSLLNYSHPTAGNSTPANSYAPTAANPVYNQGYNPPPPRSQSPAGGYLGNSYPLGQPASPLPFNPRRITGELRDDRPASSLPPLTPMSATGSPPATTRRERTCPHCGTALFTSGPFCINCGQRTELGGSDEQQPHQHHPHPHLHQRATSQP